MPRFVLLEHRWNGVHHDFMLEDQASGLLRTWAIEDPVVAGRALAARALPDHRAIYLDYEGEVSGDRGVVRRVDRGEFESMEWGPDLVRVKVSGRQLLGVVELRRALVEGKARESLWLFRLGNAERST